MANPIVQKINAELEALQNELEQFKSTVDYLNGAKGHVIKAVQSVNYAEEHFNTKVDELKKTYSSIISLTSSVEKVVEKIDSVNFPERLQSIETTVKETINHLNETRQATLNELQEASEIITNADFDGRFKKLQGSIDSSIFSNEELAKSIMRQELPEKIGAFEQNINDKLELSISNLQKNTNKIASETAQSIYDLNLPQKIDSFEKNFNKELEDSIANLKKNTQDIASETAKSIQDLKLPHKIDSFENNLNKKLEDSIIQLQNNTKHIASETAKSIQELNLPIRIDKLDTNISGILTAIQNAQGRIESVERNIADRLKESTEYQISSFINFQEKVNQNFLELQQEIKKSSKKQNIMGYITWSMIIIGSASVIYFCR